MNIKKFIIYLIITFLIGGLFTPLTFSNEFYLSLNKPFEIPTIIFPIIWSILYLLMSISIYLISESNYINKLDSIKIYFIQLVINSLWTLIFFGFHLIGFSIIWLLILITSVIIMFIKFYNINKTSAFINIPYIIWLILATMLNISIYILN